MVDFEMTERDIRTLQAMIQIGEPTSPTNIGEMTGDLPINVGKTLKHLAKGGLARQADKENNLWEAIEKGKAYLEELLSNQRLIGKPTDDLTSKLIDKPESEVIDKSITGVTGKPKLVVTGEPTPPEITEPVVPSQADQLRDIGRRLGIGTGAKDKDAVKLDAIIYYVQRVANLDDINSVWNALTEMGIPSDIKKRWIKLYSQNLTGKQIPDDLKEKLESGLETEKVGTTEKGEVAPKPKRFTVVGGEMTGDPEGDYNFKEALQLLAQQRGVPATQVDPLTTMLEAMKAGPETATAMMAAFVPLLTKEPPKQDDSPLLQIMQSQQAASQTQMQMLQQMIMTLTEDKHKAEMESIRAEIRTGQKPPESNEQIKLLTDQINALRESLHQQQLTTIQEQNKSMMEQMQSQMTRLEQQIAAAAQGKQVESKLGLMHEGMRGILEEAKGVRQDFKTMAPALLQQGGPISKRTPEERAKLTKGLKQAIEQETEARALEDEFLGVGKPQG